MVSPKPLKPSLQKSENLLEIINDTFFNQVNVCLFLLDRNFRFIQVNNGWAQLFQMKIGDFTGLQYSDLFPNDKKQVSETTEILNEISVSKQQRQVEARPFSALVPAEPGISFWDWIIQPILDKNGEVEYFFICVNDVTKRKKTEEQLKHLFRAFRTVSLCNQILLRATDEQQLIDDICNVIVKEAGYRLVWVGYKENDKAKAIRPVAWAGFDSGYIAKAKLYWSEEDERGRGPAGIAVRSGEVVYVQDFETEPNMQPWRNDALKGGYRSGIALPLKDENANVFGVLLIYSTESNAVTEEEMNLMKEMAGDLAFGVVTLRNRIERRRNQEINVARLHLIQFSTTHSLDELLEETLNETEKLTGSLIGFYHFVDDDQESLMLQNWSTRTKAEFCKAAGKGSHYAISKAGVWFDCVYQHKPVIHNDYAALPHRKGMPEGHTMVVRELVVPVLRGEKITAILGVGNKSTDYNQQDVGAVSLLADLAWEIAERKRAEEALQESERRVRRKLDTILSPDVDISMLELSDIIDCEKIQKLMDELYQVTHIGIGIIDLNGKVLVGTGWQDICMKFHRTNPESCRLCIESDLELSRNVLPGTFKQYRCKNNMWDIATPIMLGERHVGNIFLGQFLLDDEIPDYEAFRQQARRYGFNEQEYLAALDRVPRWSRELVNATMSFYAAFAGMIGNLSYSNIKLANALEERKRAEEALQESETRYRTLFQYAAEGILVADIETKKFIYANPAQCRMLGYTKEEIEQLKVGDIHPEKDLARVLGEFMAQARGEKTIAADIPCLRKDGSILYADISTTSMIIDGRKCNVGFFSDITKRKQAEEALRNTAMRLNEAQRIAHIGSWELDLKTNVLTWSDEIYRMFEIDPKKFGASYEAFLDAIHPDDREAVNVAYTNSLKTHTPYTIDHRLLFADGRIKFVHEQCETFYEDDKPVRSVGTVQDITERKRAEQNIALLSFALNNVREAAFLIDEKACFHFVNEEACRVLNYSRAELLDRCVPDVDLDFPMERWPAHWDELKARRSLSFESRHRTKDGRIFPVEVNTNYFEFEGRAYNLALVRDITERKQAEEALRESEERLRVTMEVTQIGVWDWDVKNDIWFASPTYYSMLGYEPVAGPSDRTVWLKRVHPDDRAAVAEKIDRVLTGLDAMYEYEARMQHADGSYRWHNVIGSTVEKDKEDKPMRLVGVRIDITEHKQVEEAVHRAKEYWERTFHAVPDLVAILDNTFHIVQVNKAMADRLNLTPDQCVGQICYKVIHGTEKPPSFCPHVQSLTDRQEHIAEVSEKSLGGDFIVSTSPIFESEGRMIGCIHVARDITKRKQAEDTLKHSEEEKTILNQIANVFLTISDDEMYAEVLAIVQKALNNRFGIFGYIGENGDLVAPSLPRNAEEGSLIPGKSTVIPMDSWGNSLWGKAIREKRIFSSNGPFHIPEGHIKINNFLTVPIIYRNETIGIISLANKEEGFTENDEKVLGNIANFTSPILNARLERDRQEKKRKLAEQELISTEEKSLELERQLLQSQKFESLGTLASGIAHDFNNILQIILGYSYIGQKSARDQSQLLKCFNTISKAGQRGSALVKQLLTFARKTETQFQSVDVNLLISEIVSLIQETFPKVIDLSVRQQENLPFIIADSTQLHQVLMNICVNARDAMPQGGTLSITTAFKKNTSLILKYPKMTAGNYIEIRISDTGIGMDPLTKQKIFDPFFTTKGPGKGTGLGLALVYSIIENHHGAIEVESEPGKGTTFNVYFPVDESVLLSDQPILSDETDLPGGTETVLIIEDEEMLNEMLQNFLTSKGYKVLSASDGEEGIALFSQHQKEISVVLSDFGLPKMNGDEVVRRINSINPAMKIILASGFIEPDIIIEMTKIGVKKVINKPYSYTEVTRSIRTVLDL